MPWVLVRKFMHPAPSLSHSAGWTTPQPGPRRRPPVHRGRGYQARLATELVANTEEPIYTVNQAARHDGTTSPRREQPSAALFGNGLNRYNDADGAGRPLPIRPPPPLPGGARG